MIDDLLESYAQTQATIEAMKKRESAIREERQAMEKESDELRAKIHGACGGGYSNDVATVTVRALPPSVIITDESAIPENWYIPQPPKLDKAGIKSALKKGEEVPGATLSNGGETISITLKG